MLTRKNRRKSFNEEHYLKARGSKKKRCSHKAKACGGTCIPKNRACNIMTNPIENGHNLLKYPADKKAQRDEFNARYINKRDKKYKKGFIDSSNSDSTPNTNSRYYQALRKNKRRNMNKARKFVGSLFEGEPEAYKSFLSEAKKENRKKKHKRYKNKSNYK